jgi:hypothetical protein
MSGGYGEAWATIPAKALHPTRVPVIEALLRIDEPLSAIDLGNLLDGLLSRRGAAYHLGVLETLNVVQRDGPFETHGAASQRALFDGRYRPKGWRSSDNC